jgi:hypothetical protein
MDSKRQMTKQYKDTMVPAGVFVIRNKITGRVFVGASMNLEGAINRHRFELQRKAHRNKALLRDWTELGPDNFSVERIETIKPRSEPAFDYEGELAVMLQLWCEELQCFGDKGYNTP